MGIMDEMAEMPGEVANFAGRVPGMMARLPGRMAGGVKNFVQSGIGTNEGDLYGINPRRAYWANALADLGNVAQGRGDQNTRMQGRAAQTAFTRQQAQDAWQRQYQGQIAQAALLNAGKRPDARSVAEKMAEAAGHKPGTKEYKEFIRQYALKSQVSVNMGPKVGQGFLQDTLAGLPKSRSDAESAQRSLARYGAMESLLPYIGESGVGKDLMTSFRSSLNSFGLGEVGSFVDALAESSGWDFFSGDQGATELYRALNSKDIVGRARELYPVSNSDLNILREMTASLRINDKDAMRTLIQQGKLENQYPIDAFNRNRDYIRNAPPEYAPYMPDVPPLKANPALDINGVTNQQSEWDRMMDEEYGADWRTR